MNCKLSISNLAWNINDEELALSIIKEHNYSAIEIAPTKIFGPNPFSEPNHFKSYQDYLKHKYNLSVCSFQSIWYGIDKQLSDYNNHIFLQHYTEKIIDCASQINCSNIVFGNPKLRNGCKMSDEHIINFFKTIGDYAYKHNTCISMEANPSIYSTDFINTTVEAISFCNIVNSKGLKVNLDLGTAIFNNENIKSIFDNLDIVNHIHISEPYLNTISKRPIHNDLKDYAYDRYISIEMNETSVDSLKQVVKYIQLLFL